MNRPALSFEYFPPATAAGRERLLGETTPALGALGPEFFSCTYGAGGATREGTYGVVAALKSLGVEAAPHLSFGGDGAAAIGSLLDRYAELGVGRLVALRGDRPSGLAGGRLAHASELVEFARRRHGARFAIMVAAYPEIHPESRSYEEDIGFLKRKFDAGASAGITQYFFNADAYFHFLERCAAAGIDQPIHAGIMPIANYRKLARFSRNCGAEVPRWLRRRLEGFGDDLAGIREFGIEVVSRLCQRLLEGGCPGLHFYTMNRARPTLDICGNLGLHPGRAGPPGPSGGRAASERA